MRQLFLAVAAALCAALPATAQPRAVVERVTFERDPAGKVTGTVQMSPDGRMSRYARD